MSAQTEDVPARCRLAAGTVDAPVSSRALLFAGSWQARAPCCRVVPRRPLAHCHCASHAGSAESGRCGGLKRPPPGPPGLPGKAKSRGRWPLSRLGLGLSTWPCEDDRPTRPRMTPRPGGAGPVEIVISLRLRQREVERTRLSGGCRKRRSRAGRGRALRVAPRCHRPRRALPRSAKPAFRAHSKGPRMRGPLRRADGGKPAPASNRLGILRVTVACRSPAAGPPASRGTGQKAPSPMVR